jgi:hypothetical protein
MADTPTAASARQALEFIVDREFDRKGYATSPLLNEAHQTLRAYLALAEKAMEDAERYRWLRDAPDADPGRLLFWQTEQERALIDATVDAEIAARTQQAGKEG